MLIRNGSYSLHKAVCGVESDQVAAARGVQGFR
jgi:hypothetical protein